MIALIATALVFRRQTGYLPRSKVPVMGYTGPVYSPANSGISSNSYISCTASITDFDTYQLAIPPNTIVTLANSNIEIQATIDSGTQWTNPIINFNSTTATKQYIWSIKAHHIPDNQVNTYFDTFQYHDLGASPVRDVDPPAQIKTVIEVAPKSTVSGGGEQ